MTKNLGIKSGLLALALCTGVSAQGLPKPVCNISNEGVTILVKTGNFNTLYNLRRLYNGAHMCTHSTSLFRFWEKSKTFIWVVNLPKIEADELNLIRTRVEPYEVYPANRFKRLPISY